MFKEEDQIANETNEFDLKIRIDRFGQAVLEIWIDSEEMQEPHDICLSSLVASCYSSGEFDIFTCGCGFAGCAGIEEGIRVTHKGGRIQWSLRSPQSTRGFGSEQQWRAKSKLLNFSFDQAQYIQEIQQELAFGEFNYAANVEFGPEWEEPQTFATLSRSLAEGLARALR